MAEDKPGSSLLSSCSIAFVPTSSLTSPMIAEFSQLVKKHGAEVLEPDADGKVRVAEATHIISNTIDFPEYTEAEAMMVPVVNTMWIKSTLSRNKQAQVRPYSPDPRMIFSNVVLTSADLPPTDKEAIAGAVMALGGTETKDLTRIVTHICALSMDHEKCRLAREKGYRCKIVLPHWFDDCFRLGKRIDETPYLLPDPEVLKLRPEDDVKVPSSQHLEGATSTVPSVSIGNNANSGAPKIVFSKKKVMLSWDLALTARLRGILEGQIRGGGGEVVDEVDDCNMFVCQYREGEQYVRAAQSAKDVGNLSWLYWLIVHNEWTSPLRRLLHYPVPKDGIPGFKDMRITLSNYGGEARIYLENLITAAGATYTKTMKADNTHLITARLNSEKCDAARDWNISIVNHLWIEESYAKCQAQALTVGKYTTFPPRTNLSEVIGQTFFDEGRLHAMYYPGGDELDDNAARRKRNMLQAAQENEFVVGPGAGMVVDRQLPAQKLTVRNDREADNAKPTAKRPRAAAQPKEAASTARELATPARSRHVRVGKENDTPSVLSSGSRSAKAQALSKLQYMAPDIALYEKEKKRSTKDRHGPWGGKRAADRLDKERATDRSPSPAEADADDAEEAEEDEEEEEDRRPAKRAKTALPPVAIRIMLTGFKRWVGDKNKEDADRRKLRQMGIHIVADGQPCDFLAAPQMVRTMKFLTALARGPTVIESSFIDACLDSGKLQDADKFHLKDRENERRFGTTIQKAVARARSHVGRLLWRVPIYCTAEIKNGFESYKSIAEANGAIFKVYRARGGTTIKPTTAEEDGGAPPEPVYLLTSTSTAEKQLWSKFEEMARKGNMEPRIVVSDWLLSVAMQQEVVWDEKYLVTNYFKGQL